jgi:hypothetical protein
MSSYSTYAEKEIPKLTAECDALKRQQEILAFIAFEVGYRWHSVGDVAHDEIMNALEGSVGMMQKAVEWAKEFDAFWEARPDDDERKQDFIGEVSEFAGGKFDAMVAQIRLDT